MSIEAKTGALELVEEYGWHVFRLNVSHDETRCDGGTTNCKRIRPVGGSWITSDDPSVVEGWDWSKSNGYGIDCGKSGLLVVDVDPGDTWPFNGTRIHTTGRGQHHIYEDLLGGTANLIGVMPWGVDIRSTGGMVVGPGSFHPHGEYAVAKDSPPASPPPELMAVLRNYGGSGSGGAVVYDGVGYDGPDYEGLDPWVRNRVNDEIQRQVNWWRNHFADAVLWEEGVSDDWGRGWEMLATSWAWRCACWAFYPWSGLDEDAAHALFQDVLPEELSTNEKCRGKWTRGVVGVVEAKHAGVVPPPESWDEFVALSETVSPSLNAVDVSGEGNGVAGAVVDVKTAFVYSPASFTRGRGALVDPDRVVRHINSIVPLGIDAFDGQMLAYNGGVWSNGEKLFLAAITRLFGDQWTTSKRNTCKDFACETPDTPRISRESPVTPHYVNCRNGMVEWKTGELLPHSPGLFSTVQLPWDWDPLATCPAFDAFLASVVPEDCIEMMWELLGYLIYSGNPLHTAVLLHGKKGRNGKGTFLRVVQALVGRGNYSSVDLRSLVEDKFMVAELYGKLVNIAGDIDAKWLDRTADFKAMTGGDEMDAQKKFGQPFSFTPWAVPVFSANELFGVGDSSDAFFKRWVVIPFPHTFHGREDRDLLGRLTKVEEMEGVLAHALTALPVLMKRGRMLEPESVLAAKHEMEIAGDTVREWLDEHCEMQVGGFVPAATLWSVYEMSGGRNGLGRNKFYSRLEQISGIYRHKKDGVRGFKGLVVLDA